MAEQEEKKDQAPVFEKDAIIAAAHSFGTTPEIMAGALHGITEPITREQADKKVKDFLKRPVKN